MNHHPAHEGAFEPVSAEVVLPQPTPSPRLPDQLRSRIRMLHDSIGTEADYVDWGLRFILFHGQRHPQGFGAVQPVGWVEAGNPAFCRAVLG